MPKSWFKIVAAADDTAEIFVYDEIGLWGVSAGDFVKELKAVNAKNVTVRLNSPGGSVPDGLAIYNYLKSASAQGTKVHVVVDGWAASIASIIMLAGETVEIADSGWVMIHNPAMFRFGESKDLRKAADDLDNFRETLLNLYERETEQPRDELSKWMDEETWFDAKAAVEKGFCDSVSESLKAVACAAPRNVTFKRPPAVAIAPGSEPTTENNDMNEIAKLLGIPEDAKQEQVTAAIAKLQADAKELATAKSDLQKVTAERDELRTATETARNAAAQATVQAAVDAGKVKAEAKESWVAMMLADEKSARAALAAIEAPRASTGGRAPVATKASGDQSTGGKTLEEQILACTDGAERVKLIRQLNAQN